MPVDSFITLLCTVMKIGTRRKKGLKLYNRNKTNGVTTALHICDFLFWFSFGFFFLSSAIIAFMEWALRFSTGLAVHVGSVFYQCDNYFSFSLEFVI